MNPPMQYRSLDPRPRLYLDPPVCMPDHPPPLPRRVPRWERNGSDLVHLVLSLRLTPDDLSGALDGVGVVDPFALMADSEHVSSTMVRCRGRPDDPAAA